jgi:hypothetical protein
VIGLVACAEPAPPPATDPLADYAVFLQALKSGDVETALSRSWPPGASRRREASEARLQEAVRLLASGNLKIDAVEARTEGNWALVVLRIAQAAPAGELVMLRDEYLLGVDGEWRVVARSVVGDEALAKERDASFEALSEWFRGSDAELSERWLGSRPAAQSP